MRRTERRIARLKALGQYDPLRRTASKWVFFEPMSFINESKRTSYTTNANANANAANPTLINEAEGNSGSMDLNYEPGFHSFCDIKMETHHTTTDDDDDEDDKLFEEFNAVATPQAARRLSDCIATAAAAAEVSAAEISPIGGTATSLHCKCTKRADDQVHFLEDLEREEMKLMQSTRKEITRANSVGHVGDADYNFLVSFLPQMKKMSELQNLQFRAKMSELLLTTMSSPSLCLPKLETVSQQPAIGYMHMPAVAAAPKLEQQEALQLLQSLVPNQVLVPNQTQLILRGATAGIEGGSPVESGNGKGNGNGSGTENGNDAQQQQQAIDLKNGAAT